MATCTGLYYIPLAWLFHTRDEALHSSIVLPALESFLQLVDFQDSVTFEVNASRGLLGCNVFNPQRLYGSRHGSAAPPPFVEPCQRGVMLWFNPHCRCDRHALTITQPFTAHLHVSYAVNQHTGRLCYLRIQQQAVPGEGE